MKRKTLDLLICPVCKGKLDLVEGEDAYIVRGCLRCVSCQKEYPIEDGIPHFIKRESLSGLNRRFARMYDRFAWGYRLFFKAAFTVIGMKEETGRREITDRLDPHGGRVLEVSIGPGVNLPYLVTRPDVGEIFGLDISLGQLLRCQAYIHRKGWYVDLFLGNGEELPFADKTFDGVLHVGGINFFNDQKSAIDEMIRIACPGAKILIADETEKGARGYEASIPGFTRSFEGSRAAVVPPIDLVPKEMIDTHLLEVWKGWFYCIEFRKP